MNTSRSTRTTIPSLFADVPDDQWNDWRWQWSNRITTLEQLSSVLELTPSEAGYLSGDTARRLPFAITPYYAGLLDSSDPNSPLRRCVVPVSAELQRTDGELGDPLAEERHSPIPCVVHRYPDRVLFMIESECPTYCRYCTRGRRVGRGPSLRPDSPELDAAINYVASNDGVHDILISGGEPLLWEDNDLARLLERLGTIEHVDYVRIGSKAPMTLPQRITPGLCEVLKKAKLPVYVSVHATHANELTPEVAHALKQLADAGCVLLSQTVLLHDVNDTADDLTALFRGLLKLKVKPYYLLLCDPVVGSSRFWVDVEAAKDLMNDLRSRLSGYAIPQLIMDLPRGGGKIPITRDYRMGQSESAYRYCNSLDEQGFDYPKPVPK